MSVKERIKKFTKLENITISEFEKSINVSNGYVNSISKSIGIDKLELILDKYSNLNLQWLLTGKGEMLKPNNDIVKEDQEAYERKQINVMDVPIISQYAYAGYVQGFADETYLEELPTYPVIIDRERKGSYRVFEVKGDSMDDGTDKSIREHSKVLCRKIQRHLWERDRIHFNKYLFLIVTSNGIVLKQIKEHNIDKGFITVHSFNPYFEDYNINIDDIILLFNVLEVYSTPKIY